MVIRDEPEVLTRQLFSQSAGATGVDPTLADTSESCVHDRRLKLSKPTEALVIDDADLGVNGDLCPPGVLDAIERDPTGAGGLEVVQEPLTADEVGGVGKPPVLIGHRRQHRDEVQRGLPPQGLGEDGRHLRPPQVLALEIDEVAGPHQRLV